MGDWSFRAKIVQFVQLDMMNGLENEKSLTCLKINDLRDKQRTLNNYASIVKGKSDLYRYSIYIGPPQVKCRLLISSISN